MSNYAKKSRYNKKRPYGRSTHVKKYSRFGRQLVKDVAILKGLLNTEFKYSEGRYSNTIDSTTVTQAQGLAGLTKGDGASNRDGNQVRIKSIQLKIAGEINASATSTRLRCILVIDKQANGVAPTLANILSLNTAYIDSFRDLDFRKRFVILRDFTMLLDSNNEQAQMDVYKKVDIKVVYDASNNGDITDISTNSIFMFFVSDEAVNLPTVTSSYRIRYIDN